MSNSYLVGLGLATAHVGLIAYVAWLIYRAEEPDWPMYWTLPFIVDLPASLLLMGLGRLLCNGWTLNLGVTRPPALDIPNFVVPFVLLGVGGTVWWFFLPQGLEWAWRALAG
jgi:hypothetical protein